jgi:transposase
MAIRLRDKGMKVGDIADVLECGYSTVSVWLSAYREEGEDALEVKRPSGRPTKVTPQQEARLLALLKLNPQQFGFDSVLWTRSMVAELVEREFGVTLSESATGQMLHRLGWSPQRPLYRAYEQDPERVRQWTEEEYPKVRDEAAAQGASIFFADESGVRSDYHSGTTWAPVGETPVVYGTGSRVSVNMVSAVGVDGDLHFSLFDGTMNAIRFVEFLRKLRHDVIGDLFVVVDGSSVHTAKVVKEYVESTDGHLKLFALPGYSPELNPDEWVWKAVKHDGVGKAAAKGRGDLTRAVKASLERLRGAPERVRAFFADPNLRYILA